MPTATLLLGSKSDMVFAQKIQEVLDEFGVKSEVIVASAHKVPEKVVEVIKQLNERKEPTVIITCVGMSNGLAGAVAAGCVHPVVNCPAFKDLDDYQVNIHSSLQLPSDVPVMTVLNPKNAALCAVRILAASDAKLKRKVAEGIRKVKEGY